MKIGCPLAHIGYLSGTVQKVVFYPTQAGVAYRNVLVNNWHAL